MVRNLIGDFEVMIHDMGVIKSTIFMKNETLNTFISSP